MAGDWIKMRGALLDHPKVISITRALMKQPDFREWLTPGGSGPSNGKIVSDAASRAVTTALLLRAWSIAREAGKFVGDDLHLEHSCVEDLDQFGGAPGLGDAMRNVGWAEEREGVRGIFLPNFKEFNVPMTEAERAKGYRDRKKQGITEASQVQRDEKPRIVTPRVEKSREETKTPTSPKVDAPPPNPPPAAVFVVKAPEERVKALASLCTANRIDRATVGSPYVQQWAAEGVTDDMLRDAIFEARRHKPAPELIPVKYLLPIVARIFEASPARVNAEAMRLIAEREAREAQYATH
jgi:hypothetical protein